MAEKVLVILTTLGAMLDLMVKAGYSPLAIIAILMIIGTLVKSFVAK